MEIGENSTSVAQHVTEISSEKMKIALKGERLVIKCKTVADFRKTERWLDQNSKIYFS